MLFDQENHIVKLCVQGMLLEGEGKHEDAEELFLQAWNKAVTDLEKLGAAHYLARHQKTVTEKLEWDKTALNCALKIGTNNMNSLYPSLYLNIGKCYEDLEDFKNAEINYLSALNFAVYLPSDGYGDMIKAGINNGIQRTSRLFDV